MNTPPPPCTCAQTIAKLTLCMCWCHNSALQMMSVYERHLFRHLCEWWCMHWCHACTSCLSLMCTLRCMSYICVIQVECVTFSMWSTRSRSLQPARNYNIVCKYSKSTYTSHEHHQYIHYDNTHENECICVVYVDDSYKNGAAIDEEKVWHAKKIKVNTHRPSELYRTC